MRRHALFLSVSAEGAVASAVAWVDSAKAAIEWPANDGGKTESYLCERSVSFTPRELCSLYFQVGKHLVGTRMDSPERLPVEQTLANIRLVLARRQKPR
jgi:hypothetical protein